ncbi:hypothetical protein [Caulobacter sp. Root655]|uniref:hypothetical protein n=1 Tax=Caulobacter sp. Root655 TaxID=1736578 RepID=UPI0012E3DD09|nr:hypothetical protein [Caulobacter sp. Root655]
MSPLQGGAGGQPAAGVDRRVFPVGMRWIDLHRIDARRFFRLGGEADRKSGHARRYASLHSILPFIQPVVGLRLLSRLNVRPRPWPSPVVIPYFGQANSKFRKRISRLSLENNIQNKLHI